jgi:hypothetical protein
MALTKLVPTMLATGLEEHKEKPTLSATGSRNAPKGVPKYICIVDYVRKQ